MKLSHIYEPKFGREDEPRESHTEQSHDFRESPDNVRHLDDTAVIVRFDRFGPRQNPRTYEVEINWLDVKWLIEHFVKAENAQAQYLIRILKMTKSLGEAGWCNSEEPPHFWDDLVED